VVNLKNFNWITGLFIISYHLLLLSLLPVYILRENPSIALIMTAVVVGAITSLGMTAGYHRYFAHRSYVLYKVGEKIILFLGALSVQGSALRWVYDHRIHHRYVDTEKDPYSIKKGFWYAHMGWLFKKNKCINPIVVPDLIKNKAVMFQHKYYGWLVLATNLAVVIVGDIFFKDLLGAFVLLFLARLFCTHHTTWFINSWAHTMGDKPYSQEHSAVNNAALAFFTFGEGYHNYHHTFPSDYRNGVSWYQYDPTKIVIWCLAKIGMVKNLRKVELPLIKRKMILEDQRVMLEIIKKMSQQKWKDVEEQIKKVADSLNAKLLERYTLMMKCRVQKKEERRKLKLKIKALKRNIQEEYKVWITVCNKIITKKIA